MRKREHWWFSSNLYVGFFFCHFLYAFNTFKTRLCNAYFNSDVSHCRWPHCLPAYPSYFSLINCPNRKAPPHSEQHVQTKLQAINDSSAFYDYVPRFLSECYCYECCAVLCCVRSLPLWARFSQIFTFFLLYFLVTLILFNSEGH